jgi:hypothetical protein
LAVFSEFGRTKRTPILALGVFGADIADATWAIQFHLLSQLF